MRVMFVARALDHMAGGVERMVVLLMNELIARGHDVDLLTWDLQGAEAFYPLRSEITWHRLNLGDPKIRASTMTMLRRGQAIRAIVEQRKPQAIVCFQDGPFVAIRAYTWGLGVPVIAAERNAPNRFEHTSAARYQALILQSFRFAARITIQWESYRPFYPEFLQDRIVCIPNPVLSACCRAKPDIPGVRSRYRLLSVGRLGFQKNFSVLIEAFARLASKYPAWDLVIIGDGEQRTALEALIKTLGLNARVTLPGTTNSLEPWYASSHLFCLPSRWEGFPNALAEALAHGLPAIGFAQCAGTRDLIAHGRSGTLAEGNGDVDSLVVALEGLFKDANLRRSLGKGAIKGVKSFRSDLIFSKWEALLSEVAREASHR
jgi:GalNAc-alpha-(1->4)-GalNAc-alpha-(1->3)-diNAcBac-PP-undecaprenol alpha-1,4-N-acetyl-D-galactosaminyltransferase